MSRIVLACVAALIAAPVLAQTPAVEPTLIRKPVWEEFPPGEAVDKAYPQAAYDQGVGGKVVLLCGVLDTGRLENCVVRSETPAGHGFSEAALSLAPGFRMRPTNEEGKPVAGGTVRLPIQFSPPQGATEGADGVTEVTPVDISPSGYVEGRGPKVERPVWIRKPSGQAVNKAYPKAAAQQNLGGRVVLSCLVTEKGLVVDCKVLEETPARLGFGEAAVFLSRYFQMRPQTEDGAPVGGATVRIPLAFTPAGW
ncbi:MAG TPA: TonB family protein [Caulobacter sp.]|nr:TonB family protein [Caulobacter sp.]